jgi:hypothetical protein
MQATKIRFALFGTLILFANAMFMFKACAYEDPMEKAGIACDKNSFRISTKQMQKLISIKTLVQPPGMLHNSELHGIVTVELCIDTEGKIFNIKAINGNTMAISAVIESVRTWTFTSFIRKGSRVPVIGLLDVKYDFRGGRRQR